MILGYASGLPVVAAVATADRMSHLVECPYCGKVHTHGGHGPTSPVGAANGGRLSHCDPSDAKRAWYVIVEVPGNTQTEVSEDGAKILRTVAYDHTRIADYRNYIGAFIAEYELKWDGPYKPKGGRLAPDELAFRRGEVPWPSAYYGHKPVDPTTPRFPARERPCALYWHYDEEGALLYIGITDGLAARGKQHAAKSSWVDFASYAKVRWFPSREVAETGEVLAISMEEPLFNVTHNDTPEARQRLVAYLVKKNRLDLLAPAVSRG